MCAGTGCTARETLDCGKPIDIKTTDRAATKPTELLQRDGGFLFELALVNGPTQSVTVMIVVSRSRQTFTPARSTRRSSPPGSVR